ncbi:MAG: serine/threonine-protein kinase [Myxococcota bacterium]
MPDNYVGKDVAGQFRIVKKIGSGGMGSVYKAEQPEMNRHVAIKILHPRYLSRSDLVSRFRREARAMSHLSHPNTARVFLYGQLEDGACYFVMEYLEGRNLAQVVRAHGPMDPERAISIMTQVCGALDEAHQAGIIHRDLKPENIFLTVQGGIEDYPKVLDFGLAKVTEKQMAPGSMILTREGMVFGTPEFMSPEQARGKKLDARSDIYSLGTIMYELLTGKLPFDAKQSIEFIQLHVNADPIPLSQRVPGRSFPPGLEAAVMRALHKEPDDRYTTAVEFAQALQAVLGGEEAPAVAEPAKAPVVPPPEAIVHPPTSKLPWLVLGAGVLLALGGAVALVIALTR